MSDPKLPYHPRIALEPGARVEVRNRFDGSWAAGFEIAESTRDGCQVRRLTDGSVLPRVFLPHEVRDSPGTAWG